jgi:hypothetical protein
MEQNAGTELERAYRQQITNNFYSQPIIYLLFTVHIVATQHEKSYTKNVLCKVMGKESSLKEEYCNDQSYRAGVATTRLSSRMQLSHITDAAHAKYL